MSYSDVWDEMKMLLVRWQVELLISVQTHAGIGHFYITLMPLVCHEITSTDSWGKTEDMLLPFIPPNNLFPLKFIFYWKDSSTTYKSCRISNHKIIARINGKLWNALNSSVLWNTDSEINKFLWNGDGILHILHVVFLMKCRDKLT